MKRKNIKPKRKWFFNVVKTLMKPFVGKIKIINENKYLEEKSIYLCNHVGARGPFKLEFNFPVNFRFWGTYEMCGGYFSRFKYLYKTYFIQKKHNNKLSAFIKAFLISPISGMFYKGLQLIPTYPDARFKTTIKKTCDIIKNGQSVVIFPENSSEGYHDILTQYFAGFYTLAKAYYKKYGEDIKIYNMRYEKTNKSLYIENYVTVSELIKLNLSNNEISELFRKKTNQIAHKQRKF